MEIDGIVYEGGVMDWIDGTMGPFVGGFVGNHHSELGGLWC